MIFFLFNYSYKVELKRLELTIKRLEKDLVKNPNNERAKAVLAQTKDEYEWFRNKIERGEDPGVRVL